MIYLLGTFWLSFAVTWLATPVASRLARRWGAVAVPRDRDMHVEPTPRWGGAAIALGTIVGTAVMISVGAAVQPGLYGWTPPVVGTIVGSVLIMLMGMADDRYDLRAIFQIGLLLVAGLVLIGFGVRVEGFTNPLVGLHHVYNPAAWVALSMPLGGLLTVMWVGAAAKTFDAMDGLDGLAAGIACIAGLTLACIAFCSNLKEGHELALMAMAGVGACAGFLPYNVTPARIFMSSSGGYFLGFWMATLSILGCFKIVAATSVLVSVLILGVPLTDYCFVLLRRFLQGAPLMGADRRHLHHRLLDRGLSRQQAVLVIYGWTAALCSLALVLMRLGQVQP